jgi:hypothetical protein
VRRQALAATAASLVLASPAAACCDREHLLPRGKQAGEVPLAIGDSVMLGATHRLARAGLEVDAKQGRVMHAALQIMWRRRHVHTLPPTVVIALGTNIPATTHELQRALRIAGPDRTLALVTPLRTWRPFATQTLWWAQRAHPKRVRIVDWARAAAGHGDWLWPDGTHLRPRGAAAFTRLIRTAIR